MNLILPTRCGRGRGGVEMNGRGSIAVGTADRRRDGHVDSENDVPPANPAGLQRMRPSGPLRKNRVVERIRRKDHTLWKPEPKEIADRLGWLDSPLAMQAQLAEHRGRSSTAVRADGYDFALLLGMGGSSLAPEVFRKVFGRR